jgi:hypothetical protein
MRWLPVLIVSCAAVCGAQAGPPELTQTEYHIKAGLIYNFAKLVEWPTNAFATAQTPITIGVLGEDPFGPLLDNTVKDRKIGERPIAIKRFSAVNQVHGCHVLFISPSEKARLPDILAALGDKSILTVGEDEHFRQLGGIIQFLDRDDTIQFAINTNAARRASLQISSKLLIIWQRVSQGGDQGP